MKFKTEKDKVLFEALELDEKVIRKKLHLVRKRIDRKKQRSMKNQWRRNKHKLLKGLKKWHNSTQGKRFHRALGRFNALREDNEVVNISFDRVTDALFALSSIETHLYLELKYYENDIESLSDFLEIIDMFFEEEAYLKKVLLNAYITGVILLEDLNRIKDLVNFFIDPLKYFYELRSLKGLSNDEKELEGEDLETFLNQKDFINQHNFDDNISDKVEEFVNGGQGDLGSVPVGSLGVISADDEDEIENDIEYTDSENNDKLNKKEKTYIENILNKLKEK